VGQQGHVIEGAMPPTLVQCFKVLLTLFSSLVPLRKAVKYSSDV